MVVSTENRDSLLDIEETDVVEVSARITGNGSDPIAFSRMNLQ